MKYKNMKTGATINVTSRIHGDDWVSLDENPETKAPLTAPELDRDQEAEETAEVAEAPVGAGGDFDSITVKEIKQELDANGIKYDKTAKKPELYALMMGK